MNTVEKAKQIAEEIHRSQTRRDGEPYITHPEWVAAQFKHDDFKAVAWLHDTIEDGGLHALWLMLKHNIPWRIIESVILISRLSNEPWMQYIKRLRRDEYARRVKLMDLVHNVTDAPGEQARARYRDAMAYLLERGE